MALIATHSSEAPKTFEDARLEALECGFLLACYQTLLLAMRDRRLQYKHRAVLAVLIEHMNRKTGMTWVGRDRIASELGLAVETVSNTLRELKKFGYILSENRRTSETANRSLRHYTLAGLSKAEIERQLTEAIAQLKTSGPRAVKVTNTPAKVTAGSDFESHRPQCLSVAVSNQKSPPAVDESHRRQWTVTYKEEPVRSNREATVFPTAARETTPPPKIHDLVLVDQDGDTSAWNGVSAVLAKLGIEHANKAQRHKVEEALNKAALRWKGMRGRHGLYENASDWFCAEWLPRLRADLERHATCTTPISRIETTRSVFERGNS